MKYEVDVQHVSYTWRRKSDMMVGGSTYRRQAKYDGCRVTVQWWEVFGEDRLLDAQAVEDEDVHKLLEALYQLNVSDDE
jgi:hypothetical protein